jgi:hypothetical protein
VPAEHAAEHAAQAAARATLCTGTTAEDAAEQVTEAAARAALPAATHHLAKQVGEGAESVPAAQGAGGTVDARLAHAGLDQGAEKIRKMGHGVHLLQKKVVQGDGPPFRPVSSHRRRKAAGLAGRGVSVVGKTPAWYRLALVRSSLNAACR